MSNRKIRDDRGTVWDVWDVTPDDVPSRLVYDRWIEPRAEAPEALADATAPLIDPHLERGWLCFQAGEARRRLAPIPPKWFEMPDADLRTMLEVASPVGGSDAREQPHAD